MNDHFGFFYKCLSRPLLEGILVNKNNFQV